MSTNSWFNQYTEEGDDDNDIGDNGDEEVIEERITTTTQYTNSSNNNNNNVTIEQIGDHRIIRDNVTGNITIDLHSSHSITTTQDKKRKANQDDDEDDDEGREDTILQQHQQHLKLQHQQPKIGVDKCTVCNDKISKYKCPGCFILFCSMDCLNKHKATTQCTGVRSVTQFIPLNQMTDRDIVNDFNFLENINRVHESGKNLIDSSMVQSKSVFLQKASFKRMINLYIMPKQMSRHKENTSYFRQKDNLIFWRIEWNFVNDSFKLVNDSVCETDGIKDIIFKHINDPVNRYNLKKYHKNNTDGKDPILLMKRERCAINQYYRLPLDSTLSNCLQYKELIEFPTIIVINQHELSNYTVVEEGSQQSIEIQNEQKEIIQRHSKYKYDPNLINTHDQISSLAKSNPLKRKKKKHHQQSFVSSSSSSSSSPQQQQQQQKIKSNSNSTTTSQSTLVRTVPTTNTNTSSEVKPISTSTLSSTTTTTNVSTASDDTEQSNKDGNGNGDGDGEEGFFTF